jgi:hypothetical protein
MKKYISVLFVLLVIPSLAFASWWNPLSWFNKKSTIPQVQQVNVATQPTNPTTTPKDDSKAQIEALQKQITDLKNQQSNSNSTKTNSKTNNKVVTPTPAPETIIPTPVVATTPAPVIVPTPTPIKQITSPINWSNYTRVNVNYYIKNPLQYFQQPVDIIVGVITGFIPAIDSSDSSYIEITDGTVTGYTKTIMLKINDPTVYSYIASTQKIGDLESAYGIAQRTQTFTVDGTANITVNKPVVLLQRLDNCNPFTCRIGETTSVWMTK